MNLKDIKERRRNFVKTYMEANDDKVMVADWMHSDYNDLIAEVDQLQAELAKAKPVLDAAAEWKRYNQAKEGDYNKFVGANSRLNKAVREYRED